MRVAWLTTWSRVCGIADYSKALWPSVERVLRGMGWEATLISLDQARTSRDQLDALREIEPHLIHFQHEYGIFGGKNPPGYSFPRLVKEIRREISGVHLVATAHTVLARQYRFPIKGRGVEAIPRFFANSLLLRPLRKLWREKTWGALDGVIVHSKYQAAELSDLVRVQVIPHFVFSPGPVGSVARSSEVPIHPKIQALGEGRKIAVFGFFSPDKGQDLVIEAMRSLPQEIQLVLAGGVRRGKDAGYLEQCERRIAELGLSARVAVTGFLEPRYIEGVYAKCELVLAPFRETTGSGSLAQAFARGAAILASDLPINAEIVERVPRCMALFRAGDPRDLARGVREVLEHPENRRELRAKAKEYADAHAPDRIAQMHGELYRSVIERG